MDPYENPDTTLNAEKLEELIILGKQILAEFRQIELEQEAEHNRTNNRISFITSKPIHPLGISKGDKMTIDYTWEEIHEMLSDFKRETFRVAVKGDDGIENVLYIEGIVPDIYDVFEDDLLEE